MGEGGGVGEGEGEGERETEREREDIHRCKQTHKSLQLTRQIGRKTDGNIHTNARTMRTLALLLERAAMCRPAKRLLCCHLLRSSGKGRSICSQSDRIRHTRTQHAKRARTFTSAREGAQARERERKREMQRERDRATDRQRQREGER